MNKEELIPDIRKKLTPFSNYLEMISSPEYSTNKEFRDLADSEVEKMKVSLAHIVKVMKDFEAKEAESKEHNKGIYLNMLKLQKGLTITIAMFGDKNNVDVVEEAEDKWISVDEISMYPEQEIIVYFKNEAGWHTTAAYWDTKNIVNFCEVCGNQDIWGRSILVKFFMPLPSPPKQ